MEGTYVVEYIRYGVLLYYHAASYDEAQRFVRIQTVLGDVRILGIVSPEGNCIDA